MTLKQESPGPCQNSSDITENVLTPLSGFLAGRVFPRYWFEWRFARFRPTTPVMPGHRLSAVSGNSRIRKDRGVGRRSSGNS